MSTRRDSLASLPRPLNNGAHPGLWLDKFLLDQSKDADKEPDGGRRGAKKQTSRQVLIEEVAALGEPPIYGPFFERWKSALSERGAQCRPAKTQGRLIVGLGGESVAEVSISLHRTYGVPVLPGSGLKGLAARFAREQMGADWQMAGTYYQTVFGYTQAAGYVEFLDALYVPGSGFRQRPLHADVLTVHHRDYYGGKGKAPADWDSPSPVPFLCATGQFLLALNGPADWVEVAYEILVLALENEGVGAKTSSGYGRMEVVKNA